jgi:hypothetical protein
MRYEEYEALAVDIKVEIFDLDMRETVWPVPGDEYDPGVWLPKEVADKMDDDQIGKWFLNRVLFDYGNSFEYTVTRGEVAMKTFKRKVDESKQDDVQKNRNKD